MARNNSGDEEFFDSLWDPTVARKAVERLSVAHPNFGELLAQWEDGGRALLNFLSFSPISLEKVYKRPQLLDWLRHTDVLNSKKDLRRIKSSKSSFSDSAFSELRQWKSEEMLRIAFREITGLASFAETTEDITAVATRCLTDVYTACQDTLSNRWGSPEAGFAILAMGKFGGTELNYSSDIDLMFIYGADGHLNPRFTYHEYFTRLAEEIIQVFSKTANPLFRVDLRLRPEGTVGPLVRSLAGMENYYAGYGETWERMALIKARGICGDQELVYEFNQRLQPFIFPRTVSIDLLDEIADIKTRIERDIVGDEELYRNVKLGYGGIREVEFIVQTLQLLHGAKHAFLQERSTLKALTALQELEILPATEVQFLQGAYIFLRKVEHRLQIQNELQTHTLPACREAWIAIARAMGYLDVSGFSGALATHTQAVRTVFDRLLNSRKIARHDDRDQTKVFADPESARKALAALREGPSNVHISPRTRRLYDKLKPELLGWCGRIADPDMMLKRFVRFVDAYGIRGLLFETLLASPKLLELLVRLFDSSAIFSEVVIRRPQLIEEIARGKTLGLTLTRKNFREGLGNPDEQLQPLDWVRVYLRSEQVRILLRDILGFASQEELQTEMTGLAEACLEFCANQAGDEEVTVLAMGKFGGHEVLYGADLDVVFLGNKVGAAENLIKSMADKRSEGSVFPLDARLRPDGANGMLVVNLQAYREYFERRAGFWEAQALTKARVVYGPESCAAEALVEEIWMKHSALPGAKEEIGRMYERIVKERAKNSGHFKTGRGGLISIEFVVQYLQMKEKNREPNTLQAIARLGGVLDPDEAEILAESYRFLRRIESILRRMNNTAISELPSRKKDLHALTVRSGFEKVPDFLNEYETKKGAAERVVRKYLM